MLAERQVWVELRGTPDLPFGYVYVDNTRAGFDTENGLWPTRPEGYWRRPTEEQYQRCKEALAYQSWGNLIPGVEGIFNDYDESASQEGEGDR